MKKLFSIVLVCASFISFALYAQQDYRGENKVFIRLETFNGDTLIYESSKLSIDINKEELWFDMDVDIQSFKPFKGVSNMNIWDSLFYEEAHSDLYFKGVFPMLQIDAQSDRKQIIEVNGTAHIGEHFFESPLLLDWTQMDRFVFVDFKYKLSLQDFKIDIPDRYKQKLTGVMYIVLLNGKLTPGFK